MSSTTTEKIPERAATITITLNRQPVTMTDKHPTGLEIKQAAITQGVEIQIDFQLSQKVGKKFKPVSDEQRVKIDEGDEFRAVAGDDNS